MYSSDFFHTQSTIVIATCMVVGIAILIIGAIIIVRSLRLPAGKKQLMEYRSYMELANEQRESNREIHEELLVLKEKLDSIEKILKEVE